MTSTTIERLNRVQALLEDEAEHYAQSGEKGRARRAAHALADFMRIREQLRGLDESARSVLSWDGENCYGADDDGYNRLAGLRDSLP